MKAALSTMLSDAMDDGIIEANPALQLGRRKASRADKLTAAERVQRVRPMSTEQRDAFLQAARAERRFAALLAVLAKAGLRPGEAFALKPGDLDLTDRRVRVERAVSLGQIKPTKTAGSRVVDLTPGLVHELRRHLARVKEGGLGGGWGGGGWGCSGAAGRPADSKRDRD